jgi:pimeloyl-ACP methyl ester carboxylesterase
MGLERSLVVGHSLVGAISLAMARDYPECVGGLALIGPLAHLQERAPTPFHALVIQSIKLATQNRGLDDRDTRGPSHGQETLAIVFREHHRARRQMSSEWRWICPR